MSTLKYMLYTMKSENEDALMKDYNNIDTSLTYVDYCEYIRKYGEFSDNTLTLPINVEISSEGNAIKTFVDAAANVKSLSALVKNWGEIIESAQAVANSSSHKHNYIIMYGKKGGPDYSASTNYFSLGTWNEGKSFRSGNASTFYDGATLLSSFIASAGGEDFKHAIYVMRGGLLQVRDAY